MDDGPAVATTYEVLLFADVDTRLGVERRCLIAGSHASRATAAIQYGEIDAEFPNPKVNVALVASVHDAATGLFLDLILRARGVAPLIDSRKLQRLRETDRKRLAAELQMITRRRDVPLPAGHGPGWIWWAARLLGLACAGRARVALAG